MDIPARRSEDRLQDYPAVRDECRERAQHAAQDDARDLAYSARHSYEYEALDGQDCGGQLREHRLRAEAGRDDQPGRANEFEDTESHPGLPRQRTKRWAPWFTLSNMKTFYDADTQ